MKIAGGVGGASGMPLSVSAAFPPSFSPPSSQKAQRPCANNNTLKTQRAGFVSRATGTTCLCLLIRTPPPELWRDEPVE